MSVLIYLFLYKIIFFVWVLHTGSSFSYLRQFSTPHEDYFNILNDLGENRCILIIVNMCIKHLDILYSIYL